MEWVIDTINILKHKNINCYIKFHPIKIEQSADEKAYKIISSKIKNLQNFKILQSNISYVELVNNGLKAAITCHGTVANELPYYGIKVINCGDNPHINYKMKIKDFDFLWFGWLVLVCIWNFVWPEVPPIADVLVAVVLSLSVLAIKNRKK